MSTPLIVNVVELLRWPGTVKEVDVSLDVTDLEFNDARIVENTAASDADKIAVHLRLESLSNGVSVHGTVSATWVGECRRCVTPLRERMDVEVSELYQKVVEDPDAYAIENDQINLLPMVRENILVAVPVGPLCRPDCPGLCPQCGADLSQTTCDCTVDTRDPRWSVLDALMSKDAEKSADSDSSG